MKFTNISFFKFIIIYVVMVFLIYVVSLNLLIKDFDQIENEQNLNNVKTLLKRFDLEFENLHSLAEDYAKWDDTNEFLKNQNTDYIYENFREGTNTLESLDIDFVILVNQKEEVLFSKYQERFNLDTKLFQKTYMERFQKDKFIDTMVSFEDKIIYFVKTEVLNSDSKGDSNGYLIMGKLLTKESLAQLNTIFKTINISYNIKKPNIDFELELNYLPIVELNTQESGETLINTLMFVDKTKHYIFSVVSENKRLIHQNGLKSINLLNIAIDIILFILLFFIYRNQKIVQKYNFKLNKKVEQKTKELQDLNEQLENRVKDEVQKNLQNQIKLFEQSKMANLGLMIGNIVHQWRQPLTQISMLASSIKLDVFLGSTDLQKIEKTMDQIVDKVDYMTEVTSTFRSFMMEKKEKKEVLLQDNIKRAMDIVGLSLKDQHIKLLKDESYEEEPIKIFLIVGELSEVLINIINNAKDILIEKDIKDPWVKVNLIKEDKKVLITIEDNAGGVPDNLLQKIFEENFTTKDESKGTGLGLYMSKEIITKSLNGELYCENTQNGAKFFISLPIN